MGILDEAIREHLELKRQHGADDSELQQLEDEAFGSAERPGEDVSDEVAEAPTAFMEQPEIGERGAGAGREPSIADLQEPPPPPEPPETAAEPVPEEPEEPPVEEQPAMEHEIVSGPSTEERRAIAEQPTELHDVEEELAAQEEAGADVSGPAPDDDEEYDDEDDAFWNEQRLSDELDQALEGPADPEPSPAAEPEPDLEEEPEPDLGEGDEEYDEYDDEDGEPEAEAEEEPPASSSRRDEDVLEETPDFLEEAPEDDQLWFEQKPPKDFDFDD